MSYDELLLELGEEVAQAIINGRTGAKQQDYDDEAFTEVINARPELHIPNDMEFTAMSKDSELMAQLNDIERETVLRWVDIESLREHYALFEDFLHDCMTELMGFK